VAALLSVFLGARALLAQDFPAATSRATRPAATQPQTGMSRASNPDVVVIDIGYIFKNHVRFNGAMEEMKVDLQAIEKQFRGESEELAKRMQGLSRWKPGSADYNAEEEKITRARADLQMRMQREKKKFMLREAKIYYQVYDEIVNVTAKFCQRYGISLVLRYNSEAIDSDNAGSVMKGVNRNVVFQKSVNITYDILALLNPPQQTTPTTGPGTSGASHATRPIKNFTPPRNY
jgi:Skp family chaperone for outer membrane proteins